MTCGDTYTSDKSTACFTRAVPACVRILVSCIILLLGVATFSHAATPPNTVITNTVKARYALQGTPASTSASVDITTVDRTPSTISFYKIADSGQAEPLPETSYANLPIGDENFSSSVNLDPISSITLMDGSQARLPSSQPIKPATQYIVNEPIIVEVSDFDQNQDSNTVETVFVTITVPETGDTEVIQLKETTPSSGVFRGALQTTDVSASPYDGTISVQKDARINVNYRDAADSTDLSATAALVEPVGNIALSKTVSTDIASIGDTLRYNLKINTQNLPDGLKNLEIRDLLPPGFRYITGSARLNGQTMPDNQIQNRGRSLTFVLGTMPALTNWEVSYQVSIGAGAPRPQAVNKAQAFAMGEQSFVVSAAVTLKDELMYNTALLTGRVIKGCDKNGPTIANARIYIETGQSTQTDPQGFWHMEGITPGSHVVSLDAHSLPEGLTPLLCQNNTQYAGKADSQFVDLKAGALWRADFHVQGQQKKTAATTSSKPDIHKTSPEPDMDVGPFNPLEAFNDEYVKQAKPGFEVLWPANNYVPPTGSISIVVKHSPKVTVEVELNGKKVSPLNYHGSSTNKKKTIRISRWRGVDINTRERENTLKVIVRDKSGNIIRTTQRNIHFSGEPVSAEFREDLSSLIADGKSTPEIAVLIKDRENYPMRANTHVYFTVEEGHYAIYDGNSNKNNLISNSVEGEHKALITEGGIARILLKPTTQTGEIRLRIKLANGKYKNIRTWLKPDIRKDWILVGIAEGSIGYNTLKGNMQTLGELDKKDKFYSRGRLAFFAKGKVKGKYLLSIAYDSAKKRGQVGQQLQGNINPDAYYTIYGNNTRNQYEATSSSKLFIKLEREQFYLLFGDYRTNMTLSQLSRYERTLHGIHSEHKGRNLRYNGSLSFTSNKHQREEIPGDGTSGEYKLRFPVIPNSEVVTLETRDRFHPEVILSQRLLAIHADYEIDYETHSLFFKFPIPSRDANLNPNFIVVDYESESNAKKSLAASGRVAWLTDDGKTEIGMSIVHEKDENGINSNLVGTDITYKLNEETELKAEIARSQSRDSGNAWLLEARKRSNQLSGRAYIRQLDPGFGLKQQNLSERGSRKYGVDGRYQLNDKTFVQGDIYRQQNLDNDNRRDQISLQIGQESKTHRYAIGIRHAQEITQAQTRQGTLLTLGGSVTPDNGRVTLRSHLEKNFNTQGANEAYPDRLIIGADIGLTDNMALFLEREITRSKSVDTAIDRIGLGAKLWEGASVKSSINRQNQYGGDRTFAILGLSQRLNLTENLSADLSIDHAKTLKNTQQIPVDINQPAINGSIRDDFTAFSIGLGWRDENWSWTTRLENRNGDREDKQNLRLGFIRHLSKDRDLSARIDISRFQLDNGDENSRTLISLGSAWHPQGDDYTILQRLDYKDEQLRNNSENKRTRKLIHNIHINKQAGKKTQVSLHHGLKHTLEDAFNEAFSTIVDTTQVQIRRNISEKMDIGLHAGYLHDWENDNWEYTYGGSLGYTPAKNMWLSAGYNLEGFSDNDFDQSEYTAQGPFLQLRYRADKDQLAKLTRRKQHRENNRATNEESRKTARDE